MATSDDRWQDGSWFTYCRNDNNIVGGRSGEGLNWVEHSEATRLSGRQNLEFYIDCFVTTYEIQQIRGMVSMESFLESSKVLCAHIRTVCAHRNGRERGAVRSNKL